MLNLIIGLFFVYLILSMLSSGIQEAISGWIRLRGKILWGAIEQMLTNTGDESTEEKKILSAFEDNKWMQSLKRTKLTLMQSVLPVTKYPSYIKASTFTNILLQVLGSNADIDKVKATINSMNDGKLKTFLLKMVNDAEGDITKMRTSINNWYNTTMDEVSIWYTHRSHTMLFIIGFLLASILNADTFAIYSKLSSDPETAEQIANLAENYVNSGQYQPIDTLTNDSTLVVQLDSLQNKLNRIAEENLASVYTPLGLGWHKSDVENMNTISWWVMKILGILITTFAIAMGASFWFNLLKSLLNWRSSSTQKVKPETAPDPNQA